MKTTTVLLACFLFFIPSHSIAWGVIGHRVTGKIAERYLTVKAKKEIRALLGQETVSMASNWADFIKSDSNYNYLSTWHYINLPPNLSELQINEYLKKDSGTDLFTKLNFLIRQLKNKSVVRTDKIMYLKLLIHFVGDIHQPMHTAHAEDRGGNTVKVFWFSTATNLHRVWDEHLIEFQQLSYTEYADALGFSSPAQTIRWQKQPLNEWVYESYQISEQLYKEVHPNDKLGYEYNFHHLKIMNQQLLKGGIRLAGMLNRLFG